MLGWCRFKTHDLDDGLASFFTVVDTVVAQEQSGELSGGEQELLKDALRVIVLSVSYLDGPETLAEHMDRLDKPEWQYRVYERLAADYREDERYLEVARGSNESA